MSGRCCREPSRPFARPAIMRLLRWFVLILVAVFLSGGCTSEPAAPTSDAAPTMRSTEAATPEPSSRPTQSASRRIEMPVGHCWIDPVHFDGLAWAVVPQDQFGRGGGISRSWDGKGVITRLSESRSRYADRGGHVLRLVPADDSEAAAVFKQGCD
jgi:hypothetical protein